MHDKSSSFRCRIDFRQPSMPTTRQRSSAILSKIESAETLHAITRLSEADQSRLLQSLPDEAAAKLVDRLHDAQAAQMIERLSSGQGRRDRQRAAKRRAGRRDCPAGSVRRRPPFSPPCQPTKPRDARRLMSYPPDSAGGLMITEYLAYRDNLSVGRCARRPAGPRAIAIDPSTFNMLTSFADDGKLVGVLRLRDLLLS